MLRTRASPIPATCNNPICQPCLAGHLASTRVTANRSQRFPLSIQATPRVCSARGRRRSSRAGRTDPSSDGSHPFPVASASPLLTCSPSNRLLGVFRSPISESAPMAVYRSHGHPLRGITAVPPTARPCAVPRSVSFCRLAGPLRRLLRLSCPHLRRSPAVSLGFSTSVIPAPVPLASRQQLLPVVSTSVSTYSLRRPALATPIRSRR